MKPLCWKQLELFPLSTEDRRDIPPAVQDAYDRKRLGRGIVDDQVREHRPELDRQRRQISAKMAGLRLCSQETKGGRHFLQDVSGEAPAALAGQLVPDFPEIVSALGG